MHLLQWYGIVRYLLISYCKIAYCLRCCSLWRWMGSRALEVLAYYCEWLSIWERIAVVFCWTFLLRKVSSGFWSCCWKLTWSLQWQWDHEFNPFGKIWRLISTYYHTSYWDTMHNSTISLLVHWLLGSMRIPLARGSGTWWQHLLWSVQPTLVPRLHLTPVVVYDTNTKWRDSTNFCGFNIFLACAALVLKLVLIRNALKILVVSHFFNVYDEKLFQ